MRSFPCTSYGSPRFDQGVFTRELGRLLAHCSSPIDGSGLFGRQHLLCKVCDRIDLEEVISNMKRDFGCGPLPTGKPLPPESIVTRDRLDAVVMLEGLVFDDEASRQVPDSDPRIKRGLEWGEQVGRWRRARGGRRG